MLLQLAAVLQTLALTEGQSCPQQCLDGWVTFRTSCYLFADDVKDSWSNATVFCQEHDATLAIVDSHDEDHFLQDYARRLFKNPHDRDITNSFWLGATDHDVEGTFVWYTDKRPLTGGYTAWPPGQPDDFHGHQDCLFLFANDNYKWNDVGCEGPSHPICELPYSTGTDEVIG